MFYEKGVFEGDDTIRILEEGKKHGLAANFHGDELNPMRAAHLAHKVKAHAISHLEHVSEGPRKRSCRGLCDRYFVMDDELYGGGL